MLDKQFAGADFPIRHHAYQNFHEDLIADVSDPSNLMTLEVDLLRT